MAGFYISPATRLRLIKLLHSVGTVHLKKPEKLKYLLCPIIAKSTAEQAQFYELFDRYWKEISKPLPQESVKGGIHAQVLAKIPKWLWLIPIILFLGTLAALIYREIQISSIPQPITQASHPSTVKLGETVNCKNISAHHDSLHTKFQWELINPNTNEIELLDSAYHWSFVLNETGGHHQRNIRLISYHEPDAFRDTFNSPFPISFLCNNPPEVAIPKENLNLNIGDAFPMEVITKEIDLTYEWNFGDGTTKNGKSINHSFKEAGTFTIELICKRPDADGLCETKLSKIANVGNDKAFLAFKSLERDEMELIAQFGLGTWLLMGLLSIAIIYFWVKWGTRKAPSVQEDDEDLKSKSRVPDRGPYFIPFKNRESYIRIEQPLFRFADVLRQRQEGIRQKVDVPATINATISSGGFPRLFLARDTTPTEYLFLIDEQSAHSHQAKLFEYLISFLGEKDVLVETYHYNTQFHRFWNRQHPKGIHPDMLRRLYPNHRLVIMGDAHAMLDPFSNNQHAIKPELKALFKQWKFRLLLSPLPESSWTYREGVLHDFFSVFPSDLEGLTAATAHLESGREEEDLVSFKVWREQISTGIVDPDVNYRRWRTLENHRDYLKDRPDLLNWLCGIAVYPKPNWDVSIAIGHTMKDFGVEVTYDNLLLLARIPWLQTGRIAPKLREELLEHLSPAMLNAAREAVTEELSAVQELVENSHASRQWEIEHAIQNYALNPGDIANQELLRRLHKKGWFSKKQKAELSNTYYQYQKESPTVSQKSTFFDKATPAIPDFEDFLNPSETKDELPRPFYTRDFYWAFGTSLLYILMFLFIWNYGSTPELYRWVFQKEPVPIYETNQLKDYFFVKEVARTDSSVWYNNRAIETYYHTQDYSEWERTPSAADSILERFNRGIDALEFLNRAVQYDPNYELAKTNLGRLLYNQGVADYHIFYYDLLDGGTKTSINEFHHALAFDSVRLDVLHGLGLSHYYQGEIASNEDSIWLDSAIYYLAQLEPTGFFDTLSLFPNLKSILTGSVDEATIQISGSVVDASTNRGITSVNIRINSPDFIANVMTDASGNYVFELPESQRNTTVSVRATKSGYQGFYPGIQYDLTGKQDLGAYKLVRTRSAGLPGYIKSQLLTNSITRPALNGELDNNMGAIKGIVIHYHDKAENTDASSLRDYYNRSTNAPSAHYLVDARQLIQIIPDEEVSVHILDNGLTELGQSVRAGGKDLKSQLLGIEVCDYLIRASQQLEDNLVRLLQYLMDKYGLSADQVYRHSDLVGGSGGCPAIFADEVDWSYFKNRIDLSYDEQIKVECVVRDGTNPVEGIDVTIDVLGYENIQEQINRQSTLGEGSQFPIKLKSGADGEFDFFIPVGLDLQFLISLEKEGYQSIEIEVSTFDLSKSNVFEINFGQSSPFSDLTDPGLLEKTPIAQLDKRYVWLEGNWEGVGFPNSNPSMITRLQADVANMIFEVVYPEFSCSLRWDVIEIAPDKVRFKQMENNSENCQSNRIIETRIIDAHKKENGEIDLFFYLLGGGYTVIAQPVMSRVGSSGFVPDPNIPIPEMVFVEGGTFTMGCTWDKKEENCVDEIIPAHKVTVKDFFIGKYEITNEEYAAFLNEYGSNTVKEGENKGQGLIEEDEWGIEFRNVKGEITYRSQKGYERYPVVSVTWYGAVAYANWLSQKTSQRWRLPSEAEWEYAARGGNQGISDNFFYSGGNGIDSLAWYNNNSNNSTHLVGTKLPNQIGIHDLTGNVWEWCEDVWNKNYEGAPSNGSAWLKGTGNSVQRVIRGGALGNQDVICWVTFRLENDPDTSDSGIGFRLARD